MGSEAEALKTGVSVQKVSSCGLNEVVASNQSIAGAKALLEKVMLDYHLNDVECACSDDGRTLTCSVPDSEYVAGDPNGNKYICDVWWYVRFLNRLGEIAQRFPVQTTVLRYEDVQADRVGSLRRICQHFGLNLTSADFESGATVGSKEYMASHQDPTIPDRALRQDGQGSTQFFASDMALVKSILGRNLKRDFGYDYFDKPRGFQAGQRAA